MYGIVVLWIIFALNIVSSTFHLFEHNLWLGALLFIYNDIKYYGSRNSHARSSVPTPCFRRDDLVVERAHRHAQLGPGIEVVCRGDGATAALGLAHGDELLEGGGALDGGRVGTSGLVDVVRRVVRGEGAFEREPSYGVAGVVLHDIVLDQWVGRPAVDGEGAAAGRGVCSGEVDGSAPGSLRLVHTDKDEG